MVKCNPMHTCCIHHCSVGSQITAYIINRVFLLLSRKQRDNKRKYNKIFPVAWQRRNTARWFDRPEPLVHPLWGEGFVTVDAVTSSHRITGSNLAAKWTVSLNSTFNRNHLIMLMPLNSNLWLVPGCYINCSFNQRMWSDVCYECLYSEEEGFYQKKIGLLEMCSSTALETKLWSSF